MQITRFENFGRIRKFITLEESTRREVLTTQKMINASSQEPMVQQHCQEETTNSEKPLLKREPTVRSEARADFWSIQCDFIYHHHNVPLRAEGETCPNPLKYINVTGSTHTDLDVFQEKRIDD